MSEQTPQIAEQTAKVTPDFFLIPAPVMLDPELQPLDAKVFAVVYWFERMKDGYCRASNGTIAKILSSNSNSVNNSLARLRSQGHVHCEYDHNNHRIAILTLHHLRKGGTSNEVGGDTSNDEHIKKNIDKEKYTSSEKEQASDLHRLYVLHYKTLPTLERIHHQDDDLKRQKFEQDLTKYRLTPKRLDKIVVRLRDCGYDMCAKAIVNSAKNPWNLGENDRGWTADLIDYIFRSYEQTEKLSQS